jgi:hypothetical protein
VKRQQEHDVAILLPSIQGLTERQYQLFFLFQSLISRHTPDGFTRLRDDDVVEAAGAVASTLETAARGVIYDHAAQSPPAQRLATEIKAMLAEMRQQGATVYDREAAIVLRAIEKGAREMRRVEPGDASYLTLMARLLQRSAAGTQPPPVAPRSLIIHQLQFVVCARYNRAHLCGLSRGNHGQAVCNLREGTSGRPNDLPCP